MKTCSCISLSGGQGKTTTIYFLALLLSSQGKKVLAIDGEPQANLTFYLGHEVKPNEPTLFEVLNGTVQPIAGIYPTRYENLFLLPADRGLFKINEVLASSGAGVLILRQRLKSIAHLFDYALIDVQPTRSQLCLTATGASDFVLIPAETNVKGVNSVFDTLKFLTEQQELTVFNGQIQGVIPFRDRWVGMNQTLNSRNAIKAMRTKNIHLFPSILESEKFKDALLKGVTLSQMGQTELEHPFHEIMEVL